MSATPQSRWRRLLHTLGRAAFSRPAKALLGLVVLVAAFVWALPTFASYQDVWRSFLALEARFILPLALVGAFNLISPSTTQCAALPGLRMSTAIAVDWSTSAVTNTVPGGSALATGMTWSMYRSKGLATGDIVRSVVVTGVWHTFVKFGTPLLALIWLSTERPVTSGLVQVTVIGSALFVVVIVLGAVLLVGPRAAAALGGFVDRLPLLGDGWVRKLERLRSETVVLLATRWRSLTIWTLLGHMSFWVLLVLCLRAVGVGSEQLSLAAILAALAFGRLVTALPLTPGGLGVMEVGLTSALLAVGDAEQSAVVAAVLLFRFFTFALPIPLGALMWVFWTGKVARTGYSIAPESNDQTAAVASEPSQAAEGAATGFDRSSSIGN